MKPGCYACMLQVYVAIANRVIDSEGAPVSSSLANFYDGQARCCFEASDGATMQKLVLELVNSLPMQLLFGLLGQGYKIVLGGHQLGGTVAHAMAARLLLQLRQEIKLAEQMGVNLSALSMTVDKVWALRVRRFVWFFCPISAITL